MAPRIKDIAEKANVSQATVSLVLNQKPGVSTMTRERILKIARDMDYGSPRRDILSRTENGTIRFLKIAMHGHTVNRDHNVFISDYIDGLARAAGVYDYNLEISSFRGQPVEEIIKTVGGPALRGIVVLGTELAPQDIEAFGRVTLPTLFLDTYYDFIDSDFVDMNNKDAVYKIVNHLLANGHREIGFVRSTVETNNFQLRDIGFRKAVAALHVPIKEEHIYNVDSTFQGAYQDMLNLLAKRPELPSALFCTNDIIAYGAIKALRELGYAIPDDVSVVGFDDLPLSSVMEPALTTMQVPKKQMGEIAVNLLTNRIENGGGMPPVKVQVSGELIVRESVKALAAKKTAAE